MTLQEQLRDYCKKLRHKPVTLSDMIPLMQKAADRIEQLEQQNEILKARLDKLGGLE